MFLSCLLLFALALISAESRYIADDVVFVPMVISRVRRDTHGSVTVNSDGTSGAVLKVPFAGDDKNVFSAIGGLDLDKNLKMSGTTAGLAYDNVNGHGVTLTDTHVPGFGDKLTAAGKLNVFHNDNHNLDVKAFATRNMPDIPRVPDFNTVGGGVDYMFKDKVGASASAAHTPLFDRNDYSVGGKLNLFRDPSTSFDFNAGYKKFEMPNIKSDWTPNIGFSLTKFW
ncbi:defense protein 3 [Manduca sexta]|uniref:Uncharacterized protein n=1 Tax=Manduca sexta TaxID=7130 RepID=A0A921ZE78_MANSE|nr:defense protein 3 [Manduca sexta]KAG6456240.1 hypothetical protein O3G_MSEX009621 [Manduca sexta]KAG6456241.1 hypothetical protein O3G_MSEX009621 [Manduca sexta]